MLMNNLDPEVAERPEDLVVYGGTGKAARNWEAFDAIIAALQTLENDETLLIQSGKPVGVFRTHCLVPPRTSSWRTATWSAAGRTGNTSENVERAGLIMYGQMTAGSWIYIELPGASCRVRTRHSAPSRARIFGGTLAGRFVLTAGLGGMGGAQPLAATMNDAAILGIDVDDSRIEKRLATGYCDRKTSDVDEALRWIREATVSEVRPLGGARRKTPLRDSSRNSSAAA